MGVLFIVQFRQFGLLLGRYWQVHGWPIKVPCHPVSQLFHLQRRIVEKGEERIKILHREGVIFVVVALGTIESGAKKNRGSGVDPVKNLVHAVFLRMHTGLDIAGGGAVEAGGNALGRGGVGQ